MQSRYDFMTASVIQDTEDSSVYPDPLTLNYNIFKTEQKPSMVELDAGDIERLWMLVARYYGAAEYDDVVLSLNGIPHKNFLKEGDIFFIPDLKDLESSFRKTRE